MKTLLMGSWIDSDDETSIQNRNNSPSGVTNGGEETETMKKHTLTSIAL